MLLQCCGIFPRSSTENYMFHFLPGYSQLANKLTAIFVYFPIILLSSFQFPHHLFSLQPCLHLIGIVRRHQKVKLTPGRREKVFDLLRSAYSVGQGLTNRGGGLEVIFHSSSTEAEASKTESPSKASLPEERRSSQAQL